MAFLIGSDVIHETAIAQQLPSASVGGNGSWLHAPTDNKWPVYIANSEGAVYGDKVIETNRGRVTLKPGERTDILYPSNLNEMWVMGRKDDVISWVIS